jgi:hypothetical protein
MIGFPILGKRKPKKPQTLSAALPEALPQKGIWPVDLTGAAEKTQDLLVGYDGERVGFRRPVQD